METTTSHHAVAQDYTDSQKQALIQSMCGPLMNKVQLLFAHPKKNKQLAQNPNLLSIVDLLSHHLLPQYCVSHYANASKISVMHSLCYLLASKVQAVFTAGVIRTCIDQNWDMKGFKSVLLRILNEIGLANEDFKKLQDFFDKLIQAQNLQSHSCIKAISQFLKNKNKSSMDEDDLKNPITSFQTSFDFVRDEIQKFRSQNMSHSCFTVLHPWAYDLELVDFKYIINKDQTNKITEALKSSTDAQVLWLSYFKSQLSTSADEFFGVLREVAIMNVVQEFFESNYETYKKCMVKNNFVISLNKHSEEICKFVRDLMVQAVEKQRFNILKDQIRLRTTPRPKTEYLDESKLLSKYSISGEPNIQVIASLSNMKSSILYTFDDKQLRTPINLQRQVFSIKPTVKQGYNLFLTFKNVDTEELKDLEIKFDGNLSQFKIGEGDCNHYVISNDKKLWESQFMILNRQGKYYIRDQGIVHTSRIKVNAQTQLQIHQGALLDLGKVVHYHVDKLIHEKIPVQDSNPNLIMMKGTQANYRVDDESLLRARPTWISSDENKELVQNEILLTPSQNKSMFTIGRSNRRDVEIKLKAVSADHCRIEYNRELGWFIHELEKDRLSSNGTFVFMKSLQQMDDHEPSDIIPLFDKMVISFINYELEVRLEPKTQEELDNSVFEHLDITESYVPSSQPTPDPGHTQSPIKYEQQDKHLDNIHLSNEKVQDNSSQLHQDPYEEEFQATHQPKNLPELQEENKQVNQKVHNEELPQKEEIKEPYVLSHQQESPTREDQKEDFFERVAQDSQRESQDQEMHKNPSEKSLKQGSVQSSASKQVKVEEVAKEEEIKQEEENKKEEEVVKENNNEDVKSQKSNKDLQKEEVINNEATNGLLQGEIKSQLQENPKSQSQMQKKNHRDEDDQPHDMQRSYSQHHIGESPNDKKSHKTELIHSDNEEEKQSPLKQQDDVKSQQSGVKEKPEEEQKDDQKMEEQKHTEEQSPVKQDQQENKEMEQEVKQSEKQETPKEKDEQVEEEKEKVTPIKQKKEENSQQEQQQNIQQEEKVIPEDKEEKQPLQSSEQKSQNQDQEEEVKNEVSVQKQEQNKTETEEIKEQETPVQQDHHDEKDKAQENNQNQKQDHIEEQKQEKEEEQKEEKLNEKVVEQDDQIKQPLVEEEKKQTVVDESATDKKHDETGHQDEVKNQANDNSIQKEANHQKSDQDQIYDQ